MGSNPQNSLVAMMAAAPPALKVQKTEESPVIKALLADSKATAVKVDKMAEALLALTNLQKDQQLQQDNNGKEYFNR